MQAPARASSRRIIAERRRQEGPKDRADGEDRQKSDLWRNRTRNDERMPCGGLRGPYPTLKDGLRVHGWRAGVDGRVRWAHRATSSRSAKRRVPRKLEKARPEPNDRWGLLLLRSSGQKVLGEVGGVLSAGRIGVCCSNAFTSFGHEAGRDHGEVRIGGVTCDQANLGMPDAVVAEWWLDPARESQIPATSASLGVLSPCTGGRRKTCRSWGASLMWGRETAQMYPPYPPLPNSKI